MDNYVITIGRQFGSGGRELGQAIAAKLGIPYYDKELLLQAAKASGINPEFFLRNDEKAPSYINGIFPFNFGMNPMPWYAGVSSISDDGIYKAQSDFMHHIAEQGPCVIVGRSADYVLRDLPCIINVFVHADIADCVKRILRRNDTVSPEKARQMAMRVNKLRANFYNFYTDKRWGEAANYDLCFDSSKVSIEQLADLTIAYLKMRLNKA